MTIPSGAARSPRRRGAAHPTPRLDAWTRRLTHGLVLTAIAMGLLYLSGVEDRSLERAVERSAREHDSHVQQDSASDTASSSPSGLRGTPDANVGASAALSDAAHAGSSDDTGADDDDDDDDDDFDDANSPDVDPEGQLQDEFKQEVAQAGMDELKSFLKAGDADPSESVDEEEEGEEVDEEQEEEEEESDSASAEAEVDENAESNDEGSDGGDGEDGDESESEDGADEEKGTVSKIVEKVAGAVKPLIGGDESVSEDNLIMSDTVKAKGGDEEGDKSETAKSDDDGNNGTRKAGNTKSSNGKTGVTKEVPPATAKKTPSAKTATKIVATEDDADATAPGDKDGDGKDDTDIVEKIVEKASNVVKNIVGDDRESGDTQDSTSNDAVPKKKVSTDKHQSDDAGDSDNEDNDEDSGAGAGKDQKGVDANKSATITKKKEVKVVAELVADSVVATSNATQSAKAAAEEANAEEEGTVVDKIAEKISGADAVLEKAADAVKKVVVGDNDEDTSPSENGGKDTIEHDTSTDQIEKSPDNKTSESNGPNNGPDEDTDDAAADTKRREGKDGSGDVESAETAPSQTGDEDGGEKNTVSVKRRDGTAKEVNAEDIGNTETKKVTAVVP